MTLDVLQDLRTTFGPPRNQGDRPTCVAFAVSDMHGAARGSRQPLSVEHLYYHAVQRTPGADPDDGVALGTILSALRHDGQCAESGWPYLEGLPADRKGWTPPAGATPVFKRAAAAVDVAVCKIIDQLDQGSPVILTLLLGERFYEPIGGFVTPGPDDADTELCGRLGDDGVLKAAYRGGCRSLPEPLSESDTPWRHLPTSSGFVSPRPSTIP